MKTKTNSLGRLGNKIHIPLSENQALAGLLAVKPTADMPKRKPAKKRKK